MHTYSSTGGKSRKRPAQRWRPRPHHSQPGRFGEQIAAINVYLDLPRRLKSSRRDREIVWQAVRSIALPHVRGATP